MAWAPSTPTHPGAFHPVFHQVTACPFDHPTADRITGREVFVIFHPLAIALEIARHLLTVLRLPLQFSLGGHLKPRITEPTWPSSNFLNRASTH